MHRALIAFVEPLVTANKQSREIAAGLQHALCEWYSTHLQTILPSLSARYANPNARLCMAASSVNHCAEGGGACGRPTAELQLPGGAADFSSSSTRIAAGYAHLP